VLIGVGSGRRSARQAIDWMPIHTQDGMRALCTPRKRPKRNSVMRSDSSSGFRLLPAARCRSGNL